MNNYVASLEYLRKKQVQGVDVFKKLGVNNPFAILALPGSIQTNVLCPNGYIVSGTSKFVCVPKYDHDSTIYAKPDEPPTKLQRNNQGEPISRGKFGKMYRIIRPNVNETKINKKYNKYLSLF